MGLALEEQGIVERKVEKLAGESSGVLKEAGLFWSHFGQKFSFCCASKLVEESKGKD